MWILLIHSFSPLIFINLHHWCIISPWKEKRQFSIRQSNVLGRKVRKSSAMNPKFVQNNMKVKTKIFASSEALFSWLLSFGRGNTKGFWKAIHTSREDEESVFRPFAFKWEHVILIWFRYAFIDRAKVLHSFVKLLFF